MAKMKSAGMDFEKPIIELEQRIAELSGAKGRKNLDALKTLRKDLENLQTEIFGKLTAWEKVQVARHPQRPQTSDYLELIVEDFMELHGDRAFSDDRAIITGLGRLDDHRIMFIGHQKGKTTREKVACYFGCAHPEGYRKALLKMQLAEKFHIPIVTFIDTPGAYPGIGAEERGQAQIIAKNLMEMAHLKTPIICVVIGEGGSGGALGIGVGDKLAMMEHAYYSVISPEGCAAILWRSGDNAPEAAEALRLTATDLTGLGVCDDVIPEPLGGAHRDPAKAAQAIKKQVIKYIKELSKLSADELLEARYRKLRAVGRFIEGSAPSGSAGNGEKRD